jgi:hypothetical protein
MACEWLEEGRRVRCNAVDGELIPSLHERERYCRSERNYASCPTFQLYQVSCRRVAQEEYYAIWTEPQLPPLIPRAPSLRAEVEPALARAV